MIEYQKGFNTSADSESSAMVNFINARNVNPFHTKHTFQSNENLNQSSNYNLKEKHSIKFNGHRVNQSFDFLHKSATKNQNKGFRVNLDNSNGNI